MIFNNIVLFILWNIKYHYNNIDTSKEVFVTHGIAQIYNTIIIALNSINMSIFIRIQNKSSANMLHSVAIMANSNIIIV